MKTNKYFNARSNFMWAKKLLALVLAFSLFSEDIPPPVLDSIAVDDPITANSSITETPPLPTSLPPVGTQAPPKTTTEPPTFLSPSSPSVDIQKPSPSTNELPQSRAPLPPNSNQTPLKATANPPTLSTPPPQPSNAKTKEPAPANYPEITERKKNVFPTFKRLILSHNAGYGDDSGPKWGNDYSTFGIFLASDYSVGSFYPLIDLRGHRFDNDTYAANVGIGLRYVPCRQNFCEMLGLNLYYDWRQGYLNEYNQFGIGLEILGKRWDLRANGYFPVGQKKYKVTCIYDQYVGNYVIIEKRYEVTTYGYNLEVGWLMIDSKKFLFYAAAGPYYLTSKSCCFKPTIGGKIRIRPQYKDYLALDVSYYRDRNSHQIWETTLILSLPLYQLSNQNERPCRLSDRQIYQPIERMEIMTLGNHCCWTQNY